ncbi:hypothetical protein [Escherichia coli]|uniref:hypothetical protein n=1 Tax=Escherichia coli TaxID=562 RepID=UPI0014853185|nr:hypothetical protein [Escherichia coli]
MFTTTVLLVRLAFSTMVQFCTGFPVPSLSTPEIFTVHTFSTNKKKPAAVTPRASGQCNFTFPQKGG